MGNGPALQIAGYWKPLDALRFDEIEGQPMFGAAATASDGRDFEHGRSFARVHLWLWGDVEAHPTVEPGTRFVVWYGGDIGEGIVRSS